MICAGGLSVVLVVCDCTHVCDCMLDLFQLLLRFFVNVGVPVIVISRFQNRY